MTSDTVVVWGNCQAEPLARLLTDPLARHGLRVELVPPVFLVDDRGLQQVQDLVRRSALLISQPVRDEYRVRGCGTSQLAALLPPGGRLVTVPVIYHVGPYPYQVTVNGGDGGRVDAPLTDYHDLRTLVAAERGLDVAATVRWWPAPSAAAVRTVAADSLDKLRRREAILDVRASPYIGIPDGFWTLDHPANAVLAPVARDVLSVLGFDEPVDVPEREFLGARRAPLEPAVVAALGWPAARARPEWIVERRAVPAEEILAAHLGLYAQRPDLVTDARARYAERLSVLGL